MVLHQLTGLSIADTDSPVQTYDQLGGRGTVFNKALAISMHLGYPWHSLEYVVISPAIEGQESSVGEHLQHTDARTAEQRELATRGVPLARLGEPEEVAQAVLYLATANFCTGTILNLSGGNVRAVMC